MPPTTVLTVLVVEDMKSVRELLGQVLGDEN